MYWVTRTRSVRKVDRPWGTSIPFDPYLNPLRSYMNYHRYQGSSGHIKDRQIDIEVFRILEFWSHSSSGFGFYLNLAVSASILGCRITPQPTATTSPTSSAVHGRGCTPKNNKEHILFSDECYLFTGRAPKSIPTWPSYASCSTVKFLLRSLR